MAISLKSMLSSLESLDDEELETLKEEIDAVIEARNDAEENDDDDEEEDDE